MIFDDKYSKTLPFSNAVESVKIVKKVTLFDKVVI